MSTARILIIAGSDSGGGAGIQADIKTVTMLGGHAMTAITAITAQNTLGVTDVMPVPTEMVLAQIDACVSDIGVDVVKIGMIGSAETANAVADRLEKLEGVPIVFDPVMVATSGSVLADEETIAAFGRLMRIATVVTPNTAELEALSGQKVTNEIEQHQAADALISMGSKTVLAKGGHLTFEGYTYGTNQSGQPYRYENSTQVYDFLYQPDVAEAPEIHWNSPRIETPHTHGTGCTLASAIATGLAQQMPLPAAVARARDFVRLALHNAPGLGAGHGPMGHQMVRNDGLFTGPALNQITLPARNYEESVKFYHQLGLTLIVDSPDNGYARFEAANGVTLSIHVDDDAAGGATLYLESGALDGWVAWLMQRGIKMDQMPQDESWGWREARLTDPAGNRICLYQAGEYRRFPPWRVS